MPFRTKNLLLLLLVTLLAGVSALFILPQGFGNQVLPWRLGLDLVGGSYLVYEVDMNGIASADRGSVLSGLRDVMERRVNVFGVSEPRVTTAKRGDSHQLIVELAGIKDLEEAVKQIGRVALLDFREVRITGTGEQEKAEFIPTGLTGRFLKKAQIVPDQTTGQSIIAIDFDAEGARLFEALTKRNIGKPLAIFLDGDLISNPTVQEAISGGSAQISGNMDHKEVRRLVSLFNAGALPAPIHIISQQTIGASLGIDSLEKAIKAGLVGTLAIIIFMLLYYRSLGFVASLALVFYIAFALAVFKLFGITMTLAGIAGFILSIGMAVDANILIFARMKEESARGVSRSGALEEGFRRAWPSIRDSNISTMLTSIILYYFTSSFVKGFALTLLLGVVVSMFSAIIVTRIILRAFSRQ
ncbi:MAG: protein translocase subunit SecD [bacterium]|nr:protein translocase subunit SecD [bacterium]